MSCMELAAPPVLRASDPPEFLSKNADKTSVRQASSQGRIRMQLVLYLTPFLNTPQPQNHGRTAERQG
jgi:hypothetical protein